MSLKPSHTTTTHRASSPLRTHTTVYLQNNSPRQTDNTATSSSRILLSRRTHSARGTTRNNDVQRDFIAENKHMYTSGSDSQSLHTGIHASAVRRSRSPSRRSSSTDAFQRLIQDEPDYTSDSHSVYDHDYNRGQSGYNSLDYRTVDSDTRRIDYEAYTEEKKKRKLYESQNHFLQQKIINFEQVERNLEKYKNLYHKLVADQDKNKEDMSLLKKDNSDLKQNLQKIQEEKEKCDEELRDARETLKKSIPDPNSVKDYKIISTRPYVEKDEHMKEIKSLRERNSQLEQKVERKENAIAQMKKEARVKLTSQETQSKNHSEHGVSLEKLKTERFEKDEELNVAKGQIESLKTNQMVVEREMKDLREKIRLNENELKKNDTNKNNVSELRAHLVRKNEELNVANATIKSLENQNQERQKKLKETQIKTNEENRRSLKRLEEELVNKKEELDLAKATIESLNHGQQFSTGYHDTKSFVRLKLNGSTSQANNFYEKKACMMQMLEEMTLEYEKAKSTAVLTRDEGNWKQNADKWKAECVKMRNEQEENIRLVARQHSNIEDLSNRLAAEMGTKMASNETSVENVSIKNRPIKVGEEYSQICSEQWLMAKEDIDTWHDSDEEEKLKFMCEVLMVAQEYAKSFHYEMLNNLQELLSNPLRAADDSNNPTSSFTSITRTQSTRYPQTSMITAQRTGAIKSGDSHNLPTALLNAFSDHMRVTVESLDISPLVNKVRQELERKYQVIMNALKESMQRSNSPILLYIRACAAITWKMVNQRPMMEFNASGKYDKHKPETQEINWGSDEPRSSVVVCYAYPTLYHNTNIMAKGKVLLRKQIYHSYRR